MTSLPWITIRQPQPYDIVDEPVGVCGIGTGFESSFVARVRDGNGTELVVRPIQAGGMGILGNFHIELPCGVPATPQGTLEVFDISARDGSELHKVVVPIIFGHVLVNPYLGFAQYTVTYGDTLLSIAQEFYGDASQWQRLFEANRYQINNPDIILPGQVLRVPQ